MKQFTSEMAQAEKTTWVLVLAQLPPNRYALKTVILLQGPICRMGWEIQRSAQGPSASDGLGFSGWQGVSDRLGNPPV